jgi:predicted nucleic acid-binding protein
MWLFDATPLIYLAKVDRLALVQHLEPSCVLPERVYDEVVETGLKHGYPDARRIERSVDADRFDILSVETTALLTRL